MKEGKYVNIVDCVPYNIAEHEPKEREQLIKLIAKYDLETTCGHEKDCCTLNTSVGGVSFWYP